jgi:hypothetical protein
MRLPGSHNTKFGEWTDVVVIEQRAGSYALKQLEQWLMTAERVLRRRSVARRNAPSNAWEMLAEEQTYKPPIDVEERLGVMQYRGPDDSAIHRTQLSVTAALLTRGCPVDDVVFHVLRATVDAAGPAGRGWDWFEEERGARLASTRACVRSR